MPNEKITIITVTYKRPKLLLRCMDSIAAQDYEGPLEHIIVGDGCPVLLEKETFFKSYYSTIEKKIDVILLHEPRNIERYVWERVASNKNRAVVKSSGDLIVNLDDDNTIAPNHLSSLYGKICEGYDAAYSWRFLFYADGKPYSANRYPWIIGNDRLRASILFSIQSKNNVFSEGKNLVRDTLDLQYRGKLYCTVDANEWMIRKRVFIENGLKFTDDYSYTDILYGHCEDYLFGTKIMALKLKVGCTNLPTLNYYLSGNSQDPKNE